MASLAYSQTVNTGVEVRLAAPRMQGFKSPIPVWENVNSILPFYLIKLYLQTFPFLCRINVCHSVKDTKLKIIYFGLYCGWYSCTHAMTWKFKYWIQFNCSYLQAVHWSKKSSGLVSFTCLHVITLLWTDERVIQRWLCLSVELNLAKIGHHRLPVSVCMKTCINVLINFYK